MTALGLPGLLAASTARFGVSRPIVRSADERDPTVELLLDQASAKQDYDHCVGVNCQRVHDDSEKAFADIIRRYHEMSSSCDATVILGSDYTGVVTSGELSFNRRVAANLGTSVVLVVSGHDRISGLEPLGIVLDAERTRSPERVRGGSRPTNRDRRFGQSDQ
jgi:phosphate acetyltransferase